MCAIKKTMTKTLIFDIETVGENFDQMDERTQEIQTKYIRETSEDDGEYEEKLQLLKDGMGFSPLTGFVVAIAMLDVEQDYLGMYYLDQDNSGLELKEELMGRKAILRAYDEKTMLEKFWEKIQNYNRIVSFNGRRFDGPFLKTRSMVHDISVSREIVGYRYDKNPFHLDILDWLTDFGTAGFKGNLHMWSRAMGIESPKADGVSGDMVSDMYHTGKILEIARYSAGDIIATGELYKRWLKNTRGQQF